MAGFFGSSLGLIVVGATLPLFGSLVGLAATLASTRRQESVTRETARLSARLSANVKLADFRQAWLTSLREELANVLSIAVSGDLKNGPTKEYSRAATKVELLMNPHDENYVPLKDAMARFLGIESDKSVGSSNDQFVRISQEVLEKEWGVLTREIRSVVDFN